MSSIKTSVSIRSSNRKTGPMATTQRTQASCPTSCLLLGNGCYAAGRIFAVPEKFGRADLVAMRALAQRADLPNGVRFNVSGDFLDEAGEPDMAYIDACNDVARAHPGRPMIAYTHAWRTLNRDWFAFPVNASCESIADVAEAVAHGWQAVTVDGTEGDQIGDKRVVTCLAETRGITCAECKLCASDTRTRPVVSFTAHGSGHRKASAAVQAAR